MRCCANYYVFHSSFHAVEKSHSTAVQSYNTEVEILNTQKIIFNTSCSIRNNETLHCADLRVFKEALNEDQITVMKNSCGNDLSDIQLHLYMKLNTTNKGKDVMWLLQNTTIPQNELSQSKWIVFHNITEAYTRSRSFDDHSLAFRLALGGSCSGVNPSNLGLTSKLGKESIIVGYSRSGGISDEDARRAFGLLTQVHQKRRRQASNETVETEVCRLHPFNVSFSTSYMLPVVVHARLCYITILHIIMIKELIIMIHFFLPTQQISFEDLGWQDFIIQPKSYSANFCRGVCEYPLNVYHNTTKHSYIQSIVNFINPDEVPPPCCAPNRMSSLSVVYVEGGANDDTVTMQTWDEMVADSCGCL